MPIITLEESPNNFGELVPEDEILTAKVVAIKFATKTWNDSDGNPIKKTEFSFNVDDPESPFDGMRLWGETSQIFNTNENCKLRAWCQEILGQELHPPFNLDTDDLIGNRCRVVIGVREYEKDGEKKKRNHVKDVIRAKNGNAFASVDSLDEEPF